MTHIL
jgi:hypothetical protein